MVKHICGEHTVASHHTRLLPHERRAQCTGIRCLTGLQPDTDDDDDTAEAQRPSHT